MKLEIVFSASVKKKEDLSVSFLADCTT